MWERLPIHRPMLVENCSLHDDVHGISSLKWVPLLADWIDAERNCSPSQFDFATSAHSSTPVYAGTSLQRQFWLNSIQQSEPSACGKAQSSHCVQMRTPHNRNSWCKQSTSMPNFHSRIQWKQHLHASANYQRANDLWMPKRRNIEPGKVSAIAALLIGSSGVNLMGLDTKICFAQ